MDKPTFDQYMEMVLYVWEVHQPGDPNNWRLGQTHSNVLHMMRPDLSIRAHRDCMGVDPFYRDDMIPAYVAWLKENWNLGEN